MNAHCDRLADTNPELFARTDMTPEDKLHTAMTLDCAEQVVGENGVDLEVSRRLARYLVLYANGVAPSKAIAAVHGTEWDS